MTIWVWVKIEYPSYWMVSTENRQVNLWSPRSLILTHIYICMARISGFVLRSFYTAKARVIPVISTKKTPSK